MLLGNDFLRDLILYRSIVLNLTSFYLTFSTWFELITFLLLLSSLLFSSFLFISPFYSIWWLWVVCHIRWYDGPWLDYFEWIDLNATWYTSINAIFYVIRTSASVCEMLHTHWLQLYCPTMYLMISIIIFTLGWSNSITFGCYWRSFGSCESTYRRRSQYGSSG